MSTDIVVRFGRHIRELRKARHMNQTVFADKVGTDQATISRVENAKQEPCLRFLNELAGGLKMPLSEMLKGL
jgi:transcriptional regulator with XRE-family HTH domain